MRKQEWYNIAVYGCALLSVAFFVVLFFSIRCEPDDMITSLKFREQTFRQIMYADYHFNLFRPASLISFFCVGYSPNTSLYPYSMLGLFLLIVLIFVFASYKLLTEIFALRHLILREKINLLCISILLFTSLFFLTTNRIEIFGWMSAFITHFTPVAFVVLGAWIIYKNTPSFWNWLLLSLAAFIIGGSAEHIAPSVLAVIVFLIFLVKYKTKPLLYFTALLVFVYLISVITPGTLYRINTTNDYINTHPSSQILNPLYFLKALFQPYKIIGILFLLVSWLVFIRAVKPQKTFNIRWSLFIFPLLSSLIISIAVAAFAYKSFEATRLLFTVDFTLFIICSALMYKAALGLKNYRFILPVLVASTLCILLLFNARHILRLRAFANQYDKTIAYLQQKPAEEIVLIDSLPKPDLTNQAKLSIDPNNQENQLFCRFYNIKAKVSVKK